MYRLSCWTESRSVPRFQTTIPTLATLENSNERLYGIARLSQLVRKVKATVLEERQRNGNSDSLILDVDFAFSSSHICSVTNPFPLH